MTVTINGTTGIAGTNGSAGTPAVQGEDTNTGVFFPAADTVAISTGGSERLRVDSVGNLIVGATSASNKLHVQADVATTYSATNTLTAAPVAYFYNTNNTAGVAATLRLDGGTSGSNAATTISAVHTGSGSSALTFGTRNGGADVAERLRIDASGNLLVGRTSNNTYSGNVHATGFSSVGTNQFNIATTGSSTPFEWVMRTGNEMQFYVNNATVLARLTSSGVWTNASDARYKENIRPITYGLTEVMQLQPRSYNVIGSDKEEIGFVAQEVEPFLPELVESTRNSVTDEDRLTLSYGQLSAVIVKAIQELKAELDAAKARIAALEGV